MRETGSWLCSNTGGRASLEGATTAVTVQTGYSTDPTLSGRTYSEAEYYKVRERQKERRIHQAKDGGECSCVYFLWRPRIGRVGVRQIHRWPRRTRFGRCTGRKSP